MKEIEFYETKQKAYIPASYDELSCEQICHIFKTFDYCLRKGKSPLEFNIRVLFYLLNVKRTIKGIIREILHPNQLTKRNENVYLLCEELLSFLFKDKENGAFLTFNSLKNPLPVVRCGIYRLYGPAEALKDISFGVFRRACISLTSFFNTHSEDDLHECIAYLYRRHSGTADRCGRFVKSADKGITSKELKQVSKIASWKKNLIMMWFAYCVHFLQTGSIVIDGEEVNLKSLFNDSESTPSDYNFNWNDLLIELAKEQSIGNIDRVDEEPLFSILGIMWHNYKERKRDEKSRKA